jgi:hypothetical protein
MARYTDEQRSDALAVYAVTGWFKQAADEVGCTLHTIKAWVRRGRPTICVSA